MIAASTEVKNFRQNKKSDFRDETSFIPLFSSVPGLVSEQESQVPQERARHAGQQKRLAPQVLLRRRDGGGAADRTASCTTPQRLPVLGQCCSLQVESTLFSHLTSHTNLTSHHNTHTHTYCTASVLTALFTLLVCSTVEAV